MGITRLGDGGCGWIFNGRKPSSGSQIEEADVVENAQVFWVVGLKLDCHPAKYDKVIVPCDVSR